jgi:hypothetical protein
MRLVPTISSVSSLDNRAKFASCLARQAALNVGLASAVTREISTNLLLDKKDHSTKEILSTNFDGDYPRKQTRIIPFSHH